MKIKMQAQVWTGLDMETVVIPLDVGGGGGWWKCENPSNPDDWYMAQTADLQNLTPIFELAADAADPNGRTIEHYIWQALNIYHLDPGRVLRAVLIMSTDGAIVDKGDYQIVRSDPSKPAYVVTRGHCTCRDAEQGNTCKHRIAAGWMRMQRAPQPSHYTYTYCLDCMAVHWLLNGETCQGRDFDPRSISNARFTLRNHAHAPSEIDVMAR